MFSGFLGFFGFGGFGCRVLWEPAFWGFGLGLGVCIMVLVIGALYLGSGRGCDLGIVLMFVVMVACSACRWFWVLQIGFVCWFVGLRCAVSYCGGSLDFAACI